MNQIAAQYLNDILSLVENKNSQIASKAKKILQYTKELQDGKITKDEAADLFEDLQRIELSESYAAEIKNTQRINEIADLILKAIKKI